MDFFRADCLSDACKYIECIFSKSIFSWPSLQGWKDVVIPIIFLLVVEWKQREYSHGLDISRIKSKPLRWLMYLFVSFLIISLGGHSVNFIYSQF